MGRKSNNKKKNRNNHYKTKTQPFIPSSEMIASLKNLAVEATGTAEDNGLAGECPFCLETLPPFRGIPKNIFGPLGEATGGKGSKCHVFMCSGKACCCGCRETVKDRNFGSALENFYQREMREMVEMNTEDIAMNFCGQRAKRPCRQQGEGFITTVPVL